MTRGRRPVKSYARTMISRHAARQERQETLALRIVGGRE
jgi:hypothetical protein